uniref:Flightin n=1 Tax=Lethocerus indicus TaxID=212017 RepID=Q5GMQ5_LETIN|nr:flightin [Lethocerus indicus]CAI46902.1 flightin [Lethocerus indicus]
MFDDDEGSSWLDEPIEEPPPEAAAEGGPPPPGEPPQALEPIKLVRPPPAPQPEPKKMIFNKHWARPTFLQYDYLYNYRHSYYDDYIDFLDRRLKGDNVEPPRPQTWAERALRTYTRNNYAQTLSLRPKPSEKDAALLNTIHMANTWHSIHSKDYYNRKYKSILY